VNPLNPLYDAVAWVIMQIHAGLGALFGPASGWAWALSIVVLVVAMRLLLLPLFIKQMHATRKMTALAPQVAELKKKYKNDKQKLNEATMALYKENGANPLAGCLPIAAQLPVFFALFGVLRAISQDHAKYGLTSAVVASAQHAHIFGVTVADKFLASIKPPTLYHISGTSRLVIILTVLVSATTTFLTVRQSTKRGMMPQMTGPADSSNPMASSQKFMAYIVPVFALSGLYWQYGLVLYWVTTNLWTLGQQHVLFRRFPPLTPAAGAAAGTGGTTVVKQQIVKSAPRRPAGALYTTLSPCQMCTGAILLFQIPRVVVGEARTFAGDLDFLVERGVDVVLLDDDRCVAVMQEFQELYPEIWSEDIGGR
jgi:YidC/Oxa1 family membrane protein insertase